MGDRRWWPHFLQWRRDHLGAALPDTRRVVRRCCRRRAGPGGGGRHHRDLTHLWDLDSPLRLVAWNGTEYAAVDSGDRVVTSTDGLRWEVSLDVERARWEGIAAGGGRFVTVGRSTADDVGGLIATSSDGVHWSETELEPVGLWGAGRLSDVTWTGNLFVAVSTDYGVMTSPNGTAWISEPVGYGYPAGHPAGDDEHLVVVAGDMILRATHQPVAPRRADHRLVPDP